ncbi:hypothetical protein CLPU_4c00050 [Gottschalkia purinilytica]|uniref:Uncharacterized protein n=1 Tax=Gottschalkia purinilytica TaxID=1503 RepID=A0A0L0WBX0_GOTPU|nr:DUF6506 family protein [Gottschalkia purinilytica]KNF08959.1 hypothetical protein CLPU_4c00050 [Gottschalkia purinilytica]
MIFKEAYIIQVPDADRSTHRTVIETETYKLIAVLVKDQNQALEESLELVKNEDVNCIILCAGFSNENVGEISKAVGESVAVNVVRGDGRSNQIVANCIEKAGWF